MRHQLLLLLLLPIAAAPSPAVPAGGWQVRSTIVDMDVPGLPGFLQRMAHGHTDTERKCLGEGQTVAALLAPDPKAGCHADGLQIADGRYSQTLTCPQKKGAPVTVARAGSYDASGFAGRATVTGSSNKGPIRIVMDQRATATGGGCPH